MLRNDQWPNVTRAPRATTVEAYGGGRWRVATDPQGWIVVDYFGVYLDKRLCQRDAIQLAWALLEAVRHSQDRNQIGTAAYHSTEAIERREASPLGVARSAVAKACL